MTRSDVDEILAQLYFRLNGYFTTGLILHSPERGQARTQIDCLVIRHPYHSQEERRVETDDFLATKDGETDLILCEVKSGSEFPKFNNALYDDHEALHAVLRWTGVFTPERVKTVAERVRPLLREDTPGEASRIGVSEGSIRVRPLLCWPPHSEEVDGKWCLLGVDIFRFADRCFNPPVERSSCSTRYNFQQWGYPFASVVKYLKEGGIAKGLEGLYMHLGVV
jgi:hypothetical protein